MTSFGIIPNEPIGDYHGNDCLSKTRLDVFRRNPELYRRTFVTRDLPRQKATEAMIIGSAAGALILEGVHAFTSRYVVLPDDAPRRPSSRQRDAKKPSADSIAAMEWWDDFAAQCEGKEVITAEQHALLYRMRDAVRNNRLFAQLTASGQPEVTFRIHGQHFDVQVRPDWWNEDGCELTDGHPYIVDLKTIAELPQDDPDHLAKHIADWGYHRSAYLYPEITALALKWKPDLPRPRFFLAFVEKEEPHHCEVVELTEIDVEIGQREVTAALTRLRACMQTGIWSASPSNVRKISLPGYYVRKSLEANDPVLA